MLGENILCAPIFKEGATSRDIYLPGPAKWTHLWEGDVFDVDSDGMIIENFGVPLGQPAVFVRDTD